MAQKRTLEDATPEADNEMLIQLLRDFPKSTFSQVSLFPFQVTVCNEANVKTFLEYFNDGFFDLHIGTLKLNFGSKNNNYQITTLLVGQELLSESCVPLSFTISFSSQEAQSVRSALQLFKKLTSKTGSVIIAPPSLLDVVKEELLQGQYHPSYLDVSARDIEWMRNRFPQHVNKLKESLEVLFFSNHQDVEGFIDYWKETCPLYVEYIKQNWIDCNMDFTVMDVNLPLESTATVLEAHLKKSIGNDCNLIKLVKILQDTLDKWFSCWEMNAQVQQLEDHRKSLAETSVQSWRKKQTQNNQNQNIVTPNKNVVNTQNNPNNNNNNNTYREQVIYMLCKSCAHRQRNSHCTNHMCKGCCETKDLKCEVLSHMTLDKMQRAKGPIIDAINKSIQEKLPIRIKLDGKYKYYTSLSWAPLHIAFEVSSHYGRSVKYFVWDVEEATVQPPLFNADGSFYVYLADVTNKHNDVSFQVNKNTPAKTMYALARSLGWGKEFTLFLHFCVPGYYVKEDNSTMESLKVTGGDKFYVQ